MTAGAIFVFGCMAALGALRDRGRSRRWGRPWMAALLAWASLLGARPVQAESRSCEGPEACCPAKITDEPRPQVEVGLGLVLLGLYNINEKGGSWDADFYLQESWMPTPGFAPQTEIVNEAVRLSQQSEEVELKEGRCSRFRRIHTTLQSAYNLRVFPFDHQRLTVQFSDSDFPARALRYAPRPVAAEIDEPAWDRLSSWRLEGELSYLRKERAYKGEAGAPIYDYATFSIPVGRHITFHLTRFFLPLFVIVVLAFSALWIDPDDLNSKVGVGVTCVLSAIALQYAEAGSLPEVAYLTLADRVFALCYLASALTILASLRSSTLARSGDKPRAVRFDRKARVVLPATLALALALAALRAYTQR